MSSCTAEFMIEPFNEGAPGSHVVAGVSAIQARGLTVEMGPFGSTVSGKVEEVSLAVSAMVTAAVNDGAERVLVELLIGE